MQQFTSHTSVSEEAREPLINSLNEALCTTIDLQLQLKQAHWNIKGPQFFARHELFDKLASRLRGHSDTIAERAATLGGYAQGTVRLSAEHSILPEYDLKAVAGNDHIRALVERYGRLSKLLKDGIELAEKKKDPVTADLYTEVLRGTELDMWFLESHINA